MNKLRVLVVFGTRPEAIKMAPLVKALQGRTEFEPLCCVSAQHREMLDSVLDTFGITPDYDLNIMKQGQSLSHITARCLSGMDGILTKVRPDLMLVHGDTTTALAGALSAFYHRIPVGHVEAGLRTGDKYSPFPEEVNRQTIGRVAELHFCPTKTNADNLRREGIDKGIYLTGNTVIDALKTTVREGYPFKTDALNQLANEGRRIVLVTCHRRENYGQPMERIFTALSRLAANFPDVVLVYPVHPAPVVKQTAARLLGGIPNICLISPLETAEMHNLMARCHLVMTDSGGLQEEAPALGKPVLVLRRETERPEAVHAGTVQMAGTDTEEVYTRAAHLLTDSAAYGRMARAANPYGDGFACSRICDAILEHTGRAEGQFVPFSP